jgi:hypothetical protein
MLFSFYIMNDAVIEVPRQAHTGRGRRGGLQTARIADHQM